MTRLEYLQESDFWDDLNNKEKTLIIDVAKHILNEINTNSKKQKVKIFEVDISDEYILDFAIVKKEYLSVLNNLLPDLINIEEYELCEQIKYILNEQTTTTGISRG